MFCSCIRFLVYESVDRGTHVPRQVSLQVFSLGCPKVRTSVGTSNLPSDNLRIKEEGIHSFSGQVPRRCVG